MKRHYERGSCESVEDGDRVNDFPFREGVEGKEALPPVRPTTPEGTRGTGRCVPSGC